MKNIFKKLCCVPLFLIILQSAYAINTPPFVYLILNTPPATAFNNGINPRGNNQNVLDILSGSTSLYGTTGYIPTLGNFDQILFIIRSLIESSGSTTSEYWVYTIVPNSGFYDVLESLISSAEAIQNNSQQQELFQRLLLMAAQFRISDINYFFANAITNQQIISATQYSLQNNELVATTVEGNPYYVATTPAISPNPLTVTNSTYPSVYYEELGPINMLAGPSCSSFSGAELMNHNTNYGTCTKHTYADLKLRQKRSLMLISD